MADEPKSDSKHEVADQQPTAASISPAPTDVTDNSGKNAPPPSTSSKIQAEPLSDGTVPTVLKPGETHKKVTKSRVSLNTIYKKADIMTTLFTFLGAAVAGGLIIGGYLLFTHNKSKAPAPTPKVTKLDTSDLTKLQSFFAGNTAGSSSEVLTINSSTLFAQRVAVSSDLKVIGGLDVGGTANFTDLNATKTATLGITNVGGQLTVNGPLTVQNPALFNGGATFKGDVSSTGNATFGGSLSAGSLTVQNLSVNGTLNVNGHLNIGGSGTPNAAATDAGASASIQGTDTAGTVSVTAHAATAGHNLVTITFHTAYPNVPTIIITPVGSSSAQLEAFIQPGASSFTIGAGAPITSGPYAFTYIVIQ